MVVLLDAIGIPHFARPIAQVIHDIDPSLRLMRLPVGHPHLLDKPDNIYAVVHGSLPPEGTGYIFNTYPESMLDDRIVRAVLEGQLKGQSLEEFDPHFAATLIQQRKRQDENEQAALEMKWKQDRRRWS